MLCIVAGESILSGQKIPMETILIFAVLILMVLCAGLWFTRNKAQKVSLAADVAAAQKAAAKPVAAVESVVKKL